MKIVDLEQKSNEWLEWRCGGITASDYPIIEGFENFKTLPQLTSEKVDKIIKPQEMSWPMMKGNILEMFTRDWIEYELGEKLDSPCVEDDEAPFLRCSLDGLSMDKSFIVEIKAPARKYHEQALSGKIPEHYLPQVEFQLMVTKAKCCYYVSVSQDFESKAIVLVNYDEKRSLDIRKKCTNFWTQVLSLRKEALAFGI